MVKRKENKSECSRITQLLGTDQLGGWCLFLKCGNTRKYVCVSVYCRARNQFVKLGLVPKDTK